MGSKLESVGISTDFFAGVLAARQIEHGLHFALGSTLAMSRPALEAIGGLESLVDYLADDFELGSRISKAGFEVANRAHCGRNLLTHRQMAEGPPGG